MFLFLGRASAVFAIAGAMMFFGLGRNNDSASVGCDLESLLPLEKNPICGQQAEIQSASERAVYLHNEHRHPHLSEFFAVFRILSAR